MEREILTQITKAAKGIGIAEPLDGRRALKRNPQGKKWKTRSAKALKGMVWHQELGWGSIEAVANYHTGRNSHLYRNGVESIAYTFAIRRNGQIVLCNDFNKAVWSQGFKGRPGDENAEFMSVMFEGLFRGTGVTDSSAGEPNEDQLLSALLLWRLCKERWSWQADDLYGHFQFGKPACPGSTFQTMIEAIRANTERPAYNLGTPEGRQQALKDLGFYDGNVDGSWGPRSRGALIRFQEKNRLLADGIWGPKTEAAITGALDRR